MSGTFSSLTYLNADDNLIAIHSSMPKFNIYIESFKIISESPIKVFLKLREVIFTGIPIIDAKAKFYLMEIASGIKHDVGVINYINGETQSDILLQSDVIPKGSYYLRCEHNTSLIINTYANAPSLQGL